MNKTSPSKCLITHKSTDSTCHPNIHLPSNTISSNAQHYLTSKLEQLQKGSKRITSKTHNLQQEVGKVDNTFDQKGRIILVTKIPPPKLITRGYLLYYIQLI